MRLSPLNYLCSMPANREKRKFLTQCILNFAEKSLFRKFLGGGRKAGIFAFWIDLAQFYLFDFKYLIAAQLLKARITQTIYQFLKLFG